MSVTRSDSVERHERSDPPLRILWRDGDWLAIHKPAGWLVHRTGLDACETNWGNTFTRCIASTRAPRASC